ncbi:unnamed protein product, partial [Polarella glacialis]
RLATLLVRWRCRTVAGQGRGQQSFPGQRGDRSVQRAKAHLPGARAMVAAVQEADSSMVPRWSRALAAWGKLAPPTERSAPFRALLAKVCSDHSGGSTGNVL